MAADSQVTAGLKMPIRGVKILKGKDVLIGIAGAHAVIGYINPDDFAGPDITSASKKLYDDFSSDQSYELIVLNKYGAWHVDRSPAKLTGPWAIGTGAEVALGAMECLSGSDADVCREAVKIACKYDPFSSVPVVVRSMLDNDNTL